MINCEVAREKSRNYWKFFFKMSSQVSETNMFIVGDAIKAQAAHVKMINRKKNLSGMLQYMDSVSPCEQCLFSFFWGSLLFRQSGIGSRPTGIQDSWFESNPDRYKDGKTNPNQHPEAERCTYDLVNLFCYWKTELKMPGSGTGTGTGTGTKTFL